MLSLQNEGESISKLRTALLEAVKTGSAADTAKLLRRRRPPFAKELLETTFDGEGVPPLHIACKHGHLGVAKLLLNEGALVDVEDADPKRRATAIAYAAWGGNIPVIEHLIQHTKASLDERDVVGNTPLLYAIYGGHLVRREKYQSPCSSSFLLLLLFPSSLSFLLPCMRSSIAIACTPRKIGAVPLSGSAEATPLRLPTACTDTDNADTDNIIFNNRTFLEFIIRRSC